MHLQFVLAAVAAAELVTAGSLHRRASLGVSRIVTELSNLSGRDFCHAYIGAEVYILPDYTTQSLTKTILRTSRVRTTETSTETIGTLRKGTSTTTVYSTTTTSHTVTVTEAAVYFETVTEVISITNARTTTLYTEAPWNARHRKRQAPALPDILSDSDPLSISAACTRIINKYPIYETATATTTKSTTTTDTTTVPTTIMKTKKATNIIPYSLKTFSTITTLLSNSTVTLPGTITDTITKTSTEQPVETTTLVEHCASDPSGNLLIPGQRILNYAIVIQAVSQGNYRIFNTQKECCQWCWRLSSGSNPQNCVSYTISREADGRVGCGITYRSDDAARIDGFPVCPAPKVLLQISPSDLADGNTFGLHYREGPCSGGVETCVNDDWNVCKPAWWQ